MMSDRIRSEPRSDANGAALEFWGVYDRVSDTFSQTFTTTPGANYSLTFNFTNISDFSTVSTSVADLGTHTSALVVSDLRTRPPPVPEPSTWAMMLIGLTGLGLVGHRQQRRLDRLVLEVRTLPMTGPTRSPATGGFSDPTRSVPIVGRPVEWVVVPLPATISYVEMIGHTHAV